MRSVSCSMNAQDASRSSRTRASSEKASRWRGSGPPRPRTRREIDLVRRGDCRRALLRGRRCADHLLVVWRDVRSLRHSGRQVQRCRPPSRAAEQRAARRTAPGSSSPGSFGSRNGNRRQAWTRWIWWVSTSAGRGRRGDPEGREERPVRRLDLGEVPGLGHHLALVADHAERADERAGDAVSSRSADHARHLVLLRRVGRQPHPGRRRAEPGPRQAGCGAGGAAGGAPPDADQQHQPPPVPRRGGGAEAVDALRRRRRAAAAAVGERPAHAAPGAVGDRAAPPPRCGPAPGGPTSTPRRDRRGRR